MAELARYAAVGTALDMGAHGCHCHHAFWGHWKRKACVAVPQGGLEQSTDTHCTSNTPAAVVLEMSLTSQHHGWPPLPFMGVLMS